MKKLSKEEWRLKNHFDINRPCYMDKQGNYVYQIMKYDEKGKLVPANVIIERDADNTDLIELLNKMDIEEFEGNETERKHRVDYIDEDANECDDETDEKGCVEPVEAIPDKDFDVFKYLFEGRKLPSKKEDELHEMVNKFLESLSKDQYELYYRHVVEGKSFGDICKEDGGKISVKGYQSRWAKIRNRASKFFGKKLTNSKSPIKG